MQLYGTHTIAKQGGEAVGYQNRKKAKTTNVLFFTDKNGLPLVMSEPQAGNYNDVYEIRSLFEQLCSLLETAGIDLKGIFMNTDAGFDVEELRQACADRQIEVNIDTNARNRTTLPEQYEYLMRNCIKNALSLKGPMLGWTVSKDC